MLKISSNQRDINVYIDDYIQPIHTVSDCPSKPTNEIDDCALLFIARSLCRESSDLWNARFIGRNVYSMKGHRSYSERHAKKTRISSYNNKEENHYAKK